MLWLQAATPMADLYKHYWKTGTTSMLASDIKKAENLNPTFLYSLSGETFNLHDGTFPQGFHLSPAFAPITSDPMDLQAAGKTPSPTDLYKRQFKAWCKAFREARAADRITIRFYAGDAVSFCRALDIYASTGSTPTHLFTSAWRSDVIKLDELTANVPATIPKYDVIETSNLMDHIGFLNLLLITRPLLKENPASQSVLYTEQLLSADENGTLPFLERICATIPTLSALLGIAPLAWVSGFTTHSNVHEALAGVTQSIERIAWVDPTRGDYHANSSRPVVSFQAEDLARVIFGIYEKIFKYEQDISRFLPNITQGRLHSMATTHYHRETVASLFQLVKRRVYLQCGTWALVEEKFLDSVRRDRSRKVGMRFYQDLRLHFHLYGIHSVHHHGHDPRSEVNRKDVPAIICVVFTIPRTCLQPLFRDNPTGTPTLQCNLGTSDKGVVAFSAIHAVWGRVVPNPLPGTKATLKEDPQGMKGESDLVVLFWAPTGIILGDITSISLAFKPTFNAGLAYLDALGPELEIFTADLDDDKYVKMYPYRPALIPENSPTAQQTTIQFSTPSLSDSSLTILAVTGQTEDQSSVVSLTARVEIISPAEQQTLLNGASVSAIQISPCTMKLSIADYEHLVPYSFPVLGERHKLRIARKSHYVEIIVPVSEPLDAGGYSLDRTPILRHNEYSPWNLHHIHVDRMPLLDVKDPKQLRWLNDHTGLQLSDRERAIMSGSGDTKDTSSKCSE
ncbi:hypothetical protein FRC08_000495 [Ceratobasidium sp. 394]|nr:hypothetical protein FRC08_000495 [Ceratobasidium sp. 394]